MKKNFIIIGLFLVSMLTVACTNKKITTYKEIDEAKPVVLTENLKQEVIEPTNTPKETQEPTNEPTETQGPEATQENTILNPTEIDYEKIKPYEVGQIMILMYHGIVEGKAPSSYQRNVDDFKKDLELLYNGGFRLIKLQDLIDNNISVEAGYTPVILTFDDGIETSFSLVQQDGKLVPKENSAVDILNKFSESHPDFGKAATFYINGSAEPFKGAGSLKERFTYLIENGYDIGNHTFAHKDLSTLNKDQLESEIGKVEKIIKDELPNYKVTSLSYPFGKRPTEELRAYGLNGSFEGLEYTYAIALREGQSGASSSPNHIKYDPLNIPRVRGSNDENTDLGWQLEQYKTMPELKYISDGDPNTISVPKDYEGNVNKESLGNKKLNIYSASN